MNNLLVVDGNSLGYMAQYKRPIVHDGIEVQAFVWSLEIMRSIMSQVPDNIRVIICWDGFPEYRYEVLPEYKGQRIKNEKTQEAKKKYKNVMHELCVAYHCLGFEQCRPDKAEADDAAAKWCRESDADQIILLTTDKDWWQLVDERVSVLDLKKRKRLTIHNFQRVTGFRTPREFLEAKLLIGDPSDNIKGIKGFGPKRAGVFVNSYTSVESFANKVINKEVDYQDLSFYEKAFFDGLTKSEGDALNYFRNIIMMDLNCTEAMNRVDKWYHVIPDKMDTDALTDVMLGMGSVGIVNNIDQWIKPFKDKLSICH